MIDIECSVIDTEGNPVVVRNCGTDDNKVVMVVGDRTVIIDTNDILSAIATAGKIPCRRYEYHSNYRREV